MKDRILIRTGLKGVSGIILLILALNLYGQQIAIPRISAMPDLPHPFEMRNWREVACKYDSLVYNPELTGDYFPLNFIKEVTTNYPEHPSFGLHSYVGTFSPSGGEAINVLPSLVGATLCGINKSDQFGRNWVLMSEEYFNRDNGENIYLNNMSGSSGNDWWYETMPNIFFYQLNALYPHTGDFDRQFLTIAERWKDAVKAMGGSSTPWTVPEMDYRAWSLIDMTPLVSGVHEPEAAGAIAWILYTAYHETGKLEYREAAEWCMEFLNSLETNPSYELQLAYGTLIAARMNAETGTNYDLEKLLNWCFDIGPLRTWGAINGTWGGYDCDGLIGEQSPGGTGYAFVMNGFQQAAALLPLLRYDERYADALGKWMLNLANASRLFYSAYLPAANQDNEQWCNQYDPGSVIAHEALKQSYSSLSPYATGDAVSGGWAATNLGLYGSSHVGMLGALIDTTGIDGILRTDLLVTDFYHNPAYPTFLIYNPYPEARMVTYYTENQAYDLYETTGNSFLLTGQSGNGQISIPPGRGLVLIEVPAGAEILKHNCLTLANGIILDYDNGDEPTNRPPRIKALAATDTLVLLNTVQTIYCTADDEVPETLQYRWNGGEWGNSGSLEWTAPETEGYYTVSCLIKDNEGLTDSSGLTVHVVNRISAPPEILVLQAETRKLHPGQTVVVSCLATDLNQDPLLYNWSVSDGFLEGNGSMVTWTAPETGKICKLRCTVSNLDQLTDSDSLTILVKDSTLIQSGSLVASYTLDGNASDLSYFQNNGTPYNISWQPDRNGNPAHAALLNGYSSRIQFPNQDHLNFAEGITVLGWIYPSETVTGEAFVISHGSWQNRWKLSLIGNNILRFTINCKTGITDLDSETALETGYWHYFAATYDGNDAELFIDGRLDSFREWNGQLNSTSYPLLLGQMLPDNASYNLHGFLDEIRIYNYATGDRLIMDGYNGLLGKPESATDSPLLVYPNPCRDELYIDVPAESGVITISLIDSRGRICRKLNNESLRDGNTIVMNVSGLEPGIYMIYIVEQGETLCKKQLIF
ncbi:MAG: LamG-like jellyroll fold domain-containing protein [Bacteroidota bacterium]